MNKFSLSGCRQTFYALFLTTCCLTAPNLSAAPPNALNKNTKHTKDFPVNSVTQTAQHNSTNYSGKVAAHRNAESGYPLAAGPDKMKRYRSPNVIAVPKGLQKRQSHQSFVSFQGQGVSGSLSVSGLAFFGSFFGNEKKNIQSHQSFVSFQGQGVSGSLSVSGLAFFGTFWGDAKKYVTPTNTTISFIDRKTYDSSPSTALGVTNPSLNKLKFLTTDNIKGLPPSCIPDSHKLSSSKSHMLGVTNPSLNMLKFLTTDNMKGLPPSCIPDSHRLSSSISHMLGVTNSSLNKLQFLTTDNIKGLPPSCIPDSHRLSSSISHMLGVTAPSMNHQSEQQTPITGTVTDNQGPLPGVTITIKGKPAAVATDTSGNYTIEAAPTDTLVFTFVGYKTVEIAAAGQTAINVTLQEDVTALQEVTVNAGYYTVKESERTGSISNITSKDIATQPVTNVLAAMQGRMAGVNITQGSGIAGGGFAVEIRGRNSLRAEDNSPLYIIDGVPYATDPIGANISTVVLYGTTSPLNSINPADIESIEVLKDADATAIYGARGANGVVLVTTKKGKAGKTAFTAGISKGTGSVERFIDMMDTQQYVAMRLEALANDGLEPGPTDYDVNGTWDADRYTNWQKEIFGASSQYTDMQASLSGGSEQTQFLAAGGFHKETTVFPGDYGYNKGNFRLNLNHATAGNKFTASFTAGYTMQDNTQPGTDPTGSAIVIAPNAPALYDARGLLNWGNGTFTNPLGILKGEYRAATRDLLANGVLAYKLADGLEIRSSFGYTATTHHESRTQPSSMYDPAYEVGPVYSAIYVTDTERHSWIAEPQLSYNRQWGKSKAQLLAGGTFQRLDNNTLVQSATAFTTNALIYNLAAAGTVRALQDMESVYKYQAFFGRINYNYDSHIIVNLTGRRDGSSRFGSGRQFATFGAVGAAWVFSGYEATAGAIPWLSFGKLRASYGSSGNDQIGDYQYLDTYGPDGSNYAGVVGLLPTRLYNPDFGWETNKKLEAAIELGFFNDRIFITAASYRNRSSNQLVGIPLPGTTGFPSVQANLDATVGNRGTELTLRTVNIEQPRFKWTTNLNLTFARNELIAFPGLEGSTYANQYVIGKPLNIDKVYHYTGLDPQTGIHTVQDANGDGNITYGADRQTTVDLNPEYYLGLQNSITCRRWQLDFLFTFTKQLNYAAARSSTVPGTMVNQPVSVANHWQQPGDTAPNQLYTSGVNSDAVNAFYAFYNSDALVVDGSYARLKNLAVSYNVSEKWLAGVRCRLSVEAQNLLTITGFKGMDPEQRGSAQLPPLRIITAGIHLNF